MTGSDDIAVARRDPAVLDVDPGRRFGAFAVVEEIGRGGMGAVYLAERADGTVSQRVALKWVASSQLDADASARLARERHVLAALEHPNIARLIDAGEDSEGIPYFAMEYVKGLSITRWCDERKLSLPDRLRLFRQVCSAVQYAHANLVVHCDIKAVNILVADDGLPKLLDFGIATTLGTEAAGENRFLSSHSAAPEQFLGQPASVATDVYALGVLLCELAGGQPPFDSDTLLLRERVLTGAPRLPSDAAPALRRQLRGDIDAIVAKALRKSPQERYASVEQLDADIARHLAARPIAIRADERGYRVRTFVRRNVLPVSLAAVLALLAIGFAVTTLRQNQRLEHERDQAQLERARAQQVTDFVVGLFRAAKPEEARGREVTARQLLERGRQQIDGTLAQQPQVKAAMLTAIAEASYSLDDLQGSYRAARESLALLDSLASPPPRDLAVTLAALIRVEDEFGYNNDAFAHEQRALALAGAMGVDYRVELALNRAATLVSLTRSDQVMPILRDALALQEAASGRNDIRVWRIAARISRRLPTQEGVAFLGEYLPPDIDTLQSDDPLFGEVLLALSVFWRKAGDLERSVTYAERGAAFNEKIYGAGSSRVTHAQSTLAIALAKRGDAGHGDAARSDFERAVEMFKQAAATLRRVHGETENLARYELNVGAVLITLNRYDEAIPYFRSAVDIGTKLLPPNSNTRIFFQLNLGRALCDLGRYDEAEPVLREALVGTKLRRDSDNGPLLGARADLACVAVRQGQGTDAERQLIADVAERNKDNAEYSAFLRRCLSAAP